MKKCLWIVFFICSMLFATIAQAENTSWIKGGLSSLGDQEDCAFERNRGERGRGDIKKCVGDDVLKSSGEFFFQISPINVRNKIDRVKGLGYRLEPWIGYSEAKISSEITEEIRWSKSGNRTLTFDATVKNIQFGTNLFLDYTIIKDLEIYAGPMIGFEMSKITGETSRIYSGRRPHIHSDNIITDFDTNFFWGGEAGAEYKLLKDISLGAFVSLINRDNNTYAYQKGNGDSDGDERFGEFDLGTEVRAGVGLTYYWN